MVDYGSKSTFQYASVAQGDSITASFGTTSAEAGETKNVYISDLKVSCGASAANLKFKGGSGQNLSLDFPANSVNSIIFQLPYVIRLVATTGETVSMVASTDLAAANAPKYIVTGYTDTP